MGMMRRMLLGRVERPRGWRLAGIALIVCMTVVAEVWQTPVTRLTLGVVSLSIIGVVIVTNRREIWRYWRYGE